MSLVPYIPRNVNTAGYVNYGGKDGEGNGGRLPTNTGKVHKYGHYLQGNSTYEKLVR